MDNLKEMKYVETKILEEMRNVMTDADLKNILEELENLMKYPSYLERDCLNLQEYWFRKIYFKIDLVQLGYPIDRILRDHFLKLLAEQQSLMKRKFVLYFFRAYLYD